ncbi:MAG: DUF952 domain-containing protein, partial [Bacteroidota bacterium]
FSTRDQVLESANLHFAGHNELVVLEVIAKRVRNDLIWEPGRNDEDFPHLYGPLPIHAVETTHFIARGPDKQFTWAE